MNIRENQKRIISFDIGIKNIAYCIIETTTTTDTTATTTTTTATTTATNYKIIDWNVKSLLPPPKENQQTYQCSSCQNKQNKKCSRNAIFYFVINNEQKYFCKVHSKDTSIATIPKRQLQDKTIAKNKKQELITAILENKMTNTSNNNSAYLEETLQKLFKKDLIEIIVKWRTANCFKNIADLDATSSTTKNANNTDLITITREMINVLNSCELIDDKITHVIIENQISNLAVRMRAIQGALTAYFLMRFPTVVIEYISAKNKLKDATEITPQNKDDTASKIYSNHKKDGIKYTTEILNRLVATNPDVEKWRTFFATQKKKDDVADALIQCHWYLNNKK